MSSLILSLMALAVGPALHRLARRWQPLLMAMDLFVFVAISGLVLLHILPHSYELAGWAALGAAAFGLIGPGLVERLAQRAARQVHLLFLVVALLGLGGHAFLDGLALAEPPQPEHYEHQTLALAIIIHRIPDGLAIWWLLRLPYGATVAMVTLALMGCSTVAGYFVGGALFLIREARWLGLLQALVAGSLVHVVLHQPHHPAHVERGLFRWLPGLLGGAVAGALLWLMESLHEAHDAPHGPSQVGLLVFLLLLGLRLAPRRWTRRIPLLQEDHHDHQHPGGEHHHRH